MYKAVFNTSNEKKDKLDKAFRLNDKIDKLSSHAKDITDPKWPNGVPKIAVRKDVSEQDMPLPEELLEFKVTLEAGTKVQLLKWQLDKIKPSLELPRRVHGCVVHDSAQRAGVGKLATKTERADAHAAAPRIEGLGLRV